MHHLIAVLPLLAAVASAQAPSPPQPADAPAPVFDVASVKPYNETTNAGLVMNFTPGRFNARGIPLRLVILNAYRLMQYQVVGGPGWLDSDRFDIAARAPDGAPPDQLSLMLQALLADRFKLVVHKETRDAPIYALVMARSDGKLGPEMTRSTMDCAPIIAERQAAARARGPGPPLVPFTPFVTFKPGERPICDSRSSVTSGPGGVFVMSYRGGGQTIATIMGALSVTLNRSVVDRTGLTGEFDFDLHFAPQRLLTTAPAGGNANVAPLDDAPTIFSAVQELGLKLESQRGPVEFLVIDSVEHPTEN